MAPRNERQTAFFLILCGVDHRRGTSPCAMLESIDVSRNCTVFNSDYLRKHELQCLRLAAECMQLVGDVRSPALQRHFLGMAKVWTTEAENGPASPRVDVPTAGPSVPVRGYSSR